MSQIVDLNSTSNVDAFIDYLLNDLNIDNPSGSERLIDNTFGSWIEDKDTWSIGSGIIDLTYDESSFSVNFSVISQVTREFTAPFVGIYSTYSLFDEILN